MRASITIRHHNNNQNVITFTNQKRNCESNINDFRLKFIKRPTNQTFYYFSDWKAISKSTATTKCDQYIYSFGVLLISWSITHFTQNIIRNSKCIQFNGFDEIYTVLNPLNIVQAHLHTLRLNQAIDATEQLRDNLLQNDLT